MDIHRIYSSVEKRVVPGHNGTVYILLHQINILHIKGTPASMNTCVHSLMKFLSCEIRPRVIIMAIDMNLSWTGVHYINRYSPIYWPQHLLLPSSVDTFIIKLEWDKGYDNSRNRTMQWVRCVEGWKIKSEKGEAYTAQSKEMTKMLHQGDFTTYQGTDQGTRADSRQSEYCSNRGTKFC